MPLTNPAEEDLDLGEHAITDISELLLIANGDASTPPEDMLTLYTNNSKLRYTDDTGTEYQVATSTDIGSYLPLAGGTMTGSINMGSQSITTVGSLSMAGEIDLNGSRIVTTSGSIKIGNNTSTTGSIAIGNDAFALNSAIEWQ